MAQALQGMAEHSLAVEAGRDADQSFHAALLRASGNAFVASLISGITAAVTWTTIFKQRHNQLARDSLPDHVRVYEAVRAGNPAAAQQAMTALLDFTVSEAFWVSTLWASVILCAGLWTVRLMRGRVEGRT